MALDADTVFEVRSDGNDDNGGGYVTGGSGTDYSQQAAAQLTLTDLACTTGGTTLTSATGGFTSEMVDNLIQVKSGTNFTAGWYHITAYTDTNTVTLDRDPTNGSNASAGTGSVGGALASPGGLGKALFADGVDGNTAWLKSGTYNISVNSPNVSGGKIDGQSANIDVMIEGYETTRGDLGAKPALEVQAGISGTVWDLGDSGHTTTRNVKIDCNSVTCNAFGNVGNNGFNDYFLCHALGGNGGSTIGFDDFQSAQLCYAEGFGKGFSVIRTRAVRCRADGCTIGFYRAYGTITECLAHDCTGDGFYSDQTGTALRCCAHGNGGDGFDVWIDDFLECVAYGNGGYGFAWQNAAPNAAYGYKAYKCAAGSNTSGNYNANIPSDRQIDCIALSADPAVDAAGDDYEPNNTAGGGALLRAASQPIYGQQQSLDIGPIQHEDAGGGGGGSCVIIGG